MEKNLVDMARDLEKLRAEAINAEKRARLHPGNITCPAGTLPCFLWTVVVYL